MCGTWASAFHENLKFGTYKTCCAILRNLLLLKKIKSLGYFIFHEIKKSHRTVTSGIGAMSQAFSPNKMRAVSNSLIFLTILTVRKLMWPQAYCGSKPNVTFSENPLKNHTALKGQLAQSLPLNTGAPGRSLSFGRQHFGYQWCIISVTPY